MKRILLLLTSISVLLVIYIPVNAFNDVEIYDSFIEESEKYEFDNIQIKDDVNNITNFYNKIYIEFKKTITENLKEWLEIIVCFFIVCLISSMLNSLVMSEVIRDIVDNVITVVLCMILVLPIFKSAIHLGVDVLQRLNEYMNFSVPGIAILLANSGYFSFGYTLNTIYVLFSNIISIIVNKAFVPILYFLVITILLSGIGDSVWFKKVINTIIKFLKYITGFILMLFSAVLTLSGFASSTSDTLAIKTAKYAISNFVPIVGNCLSETLNNIIYSSSILKKSVGLVGIITIIIIAAIPIVKLYLKTLFIKLLSIIASIMYAEKLSEVLDMMSELLNFVSALTLFMTVCFTILIGIIASVGG